MAIQFLVQLAEEAAQGTEGIGITPIDKVLTLIDQFGFFKVVLPFLLVFALVYAVVLKTKVLGDPTSNPWVRGVAAVIAFAAGFFVVAYTPVVSAIQTFVPEASFLILIVFFILLVLAMFGITTEKELLGEGFPIALAVIGIIVVLIFLAIAGFSVGQSVPALYTYSQFMMGMIPIELTEETISWLVAIVIILVIPITIIYLITRSSKA